MKLNAKGGSDSENVPTQRHHTIKNVRSRFAALHRDQGNSSRKGHVWLRRKGSHLEQDTHRVEINNGSLYPSERDVLRTHFAVEVDGDVDEGSLPWIACCSTGLLMLPGCLCDGRTYEVCGLPPVLGEKKGVSPHRSTPLRTLVTCGDSSGMWTFASAEEPCPTADHVPNAMLLHDTELPRHLERPARLRRIVEALHTSGLLATNEESKACLLPACDQMLDELILTVHAPEILANLTHRNAAAATYVNDSSLLAVRMALRVVLGAVRAVYGYGIMSETRSRTPACELTPTEHLPQYYDNAFCVVRPPGHHCTQCVADGFCLVNNVAIAAEYALRCIRERACMLNNLEEVGRVAIIDMDVHHGNGTQQIFQDRSDVLYMSLHRFDNGAFYPFTGAPQDVGSGRGKGYSINVGLNTRPPGLCISDFELLRCTRNIWMPILEQFSPHVLFISAGYDVIEGDPIGRQAVTTGAFGQAIQMLASQMSGKCVVVLEGGYNLRNLQEGSCATVHALHRAKKREAVDSKEVEEIDSSQEDGSKSESRRQRWSETMAQLAEAHKECPFGDILSRTRNE